MKLNANEIHLWYWDAKREDELKAPFDQVATEEEKRQSERFLTLPKRQEFMATRVLVRHVLSRYVDVAPKEWVFDANENGAPAIRMPKAHQGLNFNLSHTPGLIVMAVALNRELGVDAEYRDPEIDIATIARTVFSDEEIGALEALPPKEAVARFYTYWTLKEAYIKARRAGFSLPTRDFTIQLNDDIQICFKNGKDDSALWQFRHAQRGAKHDVAIAFKTTQKEEKVAVSHHAFRLHGLS